MEDGGGLLEDLQKVNFRAVNELTTLPALIYGRGVLAAALLRPRPPLVAPRLTARAAADRRAPPAGGTVVSRRA